MASILTLTSHTDRTKPTARGKWILQVILGTPPSPPPATSRPTPLTARAIAAVRRQCLGSPDPVTSTFVVVSGLALPGLLLEIDGIAVLG